jgi:hypothetical protein
VSCHCGAACPQGLLSPGVTAKGCRGTAGAARGLHARRHHTDNVLRAAHPSHLNRVTTATPGVQFADFGGYLDFATLADLKTCFGNGAKSGELQEGARLSMLAASASLTPVHPGPHLTPCPRLPGCHSQVCQAGLARGV